ncbi:hypothetical protein GGS26DRAFT_603290 [Hypomontagnella submonticulosa]|nr:hypothetical protein GGS26DRAFT_603290 [Hypomontagnella submonticulosa]
MVQYIKVELGGPDYLLYTDHEGEFIADSFTMTPVVDLADSGFVLVIGLITQSFFYTMLEAGIALIAVNLPSLKVFSISLKTGEILRSVRSFLELSFLRGNSSDITQNASGVPTSSEADEHRKVASISTRPSESSNVVHRDFP